MLKECFKPGGQLEAKSKNNMTVRIDDDRPMRAPE